jgi:hypothetical protein
VTRRQRWERETILNKSLFGSFSSEKELLAFRDKRPGDNSPAS